MKNSKKKFQKKNGLKKFKLNEIIRLKKIVKKYFYKDI